MSNTKELIKKLLEIIHQEIPPENVEIFDKERAEVIRRANEIVYGEEDVAARKRETIILTKEVARSFVQQEDDYTFELVSDKIISASRWAIHYSAIVKRISDGKFFKTSYSKGILESQDERPFDYREPEFEEVFAIEEIVTTYK